MVVIACRELEDPAATVPALVEFLNGPETRSHYLVIQTLQSIGDVSAVKAIRPFLNSTNKEIRRNAAVALCRFRDFESADAIARSALKHTGDPAEHSDIYKTVLALMEMDPEAGKALIEKLLTVEAMKGLEAMLRRALEDGPGFPN